MTDEEDDKETAAWPRIATRVSPEDDARLKRHQAARQQREPLSKVPLSWTIRDALHRGLDAMDAEVAAEQLEGDADGN